MKAPFIYRTLKAAAGKKDLMSPLQLKEWVAGQFKKQDRMELVYFEVVEDKELKPIESWDEGLNKVACIAVILGGIRLIDNLIFD